MAEGRIMFKRDCFTRGIFFWMCLEISQFANAFFRSFKVVFCRDMYVETFYEITKKNFPKLLLLVNFIMCNSRNWGFQDSRWFFFSWLFCPKSSLESLQIVIMSGVFFARKLFTKACIITWIWLFNIRKKNILKNFSVPAIQKVLWASNYKKYF